MIGTVLGLVLAAAIAWFVIRSSLRVAVAILLATTFFIPGTVLVPGSSSGYSTIHRLVLALLVLNVIRKIVRGEISASTLLPTRMAAALGLWVTLTFVIGVALAQTTYPLNVATFLWVFIVEYTVFFLVMTVVARTLGPWTVARIASTILVLVSAVAIYEHLTGFSYARWLAELIRAPDFRNVSRLGTRGGDVRVQAGFEFALAYAWAATILLPMIVVVTARARNRLLRVTPALVVLSIAWTYTRSAYAGVALGVVLLLVTSRFDRRVAALAAAGAVATLAFAFATNAYDRTFASAEGRTSTESREQRIPLILSGAAERPLAGDGLGSVGASGIRTTDSLFLLTYAEIGVLGVSGLVLVLAGAAVWTARGMRGPPPDRLLGAAAFTGVILGIASGAFVDDFTVSGLARSFWLVTAIGIVVAERVPKRVSSSSIRPLYRVLVPVAGVIAGIVFYAVAPTGATATVRFTTTTPSDQAFSQSPSPFRARLVVNTACEIIEARVEAFGHEVGCYDLQLPTGAGEVRFEAPDGPAVRRDLFAAIAVVRKNLPSTAFYSIDSATDVRSTLVRTAPVWMGLTGLALAVFVPALPPRRRRDRTSVRLAVPSPV